MLKFFFSIFRWVYHSLNNQTTIHPPTCLNPMSDFSDPDNPLSVGVNPDGPNKVVAAHKVK